MRKCLIHTVQGLKKHDIMIQSGIPKFQTQIHIETYIQIPQIKKMTKRKIRKCLHLLFSGSGIMRELVFSFKVFCIFQFSQNYQVLHLHLET